MMHSAHAVQLKLESNETLEKALEEYPVSFLVGYPWRFVPIKCKQRLAVAVHPL